MSQVTSYRHSTTSRRLPEVAAVAMIGDGVITLFQPRRHVTLWRSGPKPWRRAMDAFAVRPELTRWLGAVEAAAGLWLASRQ